MNLTVITLTSVHPFIPTWSNIATVLNTSQQKGHVYVSTYLDHMKTQGLSWVSIKDSELYKGNISGKLVVVVFLFFLTL